MVWLLLPDVIRNVDSLKLELLLKFLLTEILPNSAFSIYDLQIS